MSRWTEEEVRILKTEYPVNITADLCKLLPGRSKHAIKTKALMIGLRKTIDVRRVPIVWDEEKKAKLIKLYPNMKNSILAKMLGVSENAVDNAAFKFKVKKSEEYLSDPKNTGKFQKGLIPHNKGKKGITYPGCIKTQFKKGNIPANHKPVGSTRILDGYHYTKIADPNVWELTHHEVYRKYHGEIPEGYRVVFKDGVRLNINPNNLEAITPKEAMRRTRRTKEYAARCLELDIEKRKKLLEEYPDLIELKQVQLLLSENLKQHER